MQKKRTQTQKIKRQKYTAIVSLGLLFLFVIFFLVFAYTHFSVCMDSSSGKFLQYTGSYEINKVQRNRNTNYIFTLENGHSIVVKPELLRCKRLDELPSQLSFSYSSQKECVFFAYTAIEIASNEEVFLHKDDSIAEAKMGAIIGVLMAGLTLSLAIPAFSVFLKPKYCVTRGRVTKDGLKPLKK